MIEYLLPSVPEPAFGQLLDILMMVTVGGRERPLEQHRALIEPTGYTFTRLIPVGSTSGSQPPWGVLEFRRG